MRAAGLDSMEGEMCEIPWNVQKVDTDDKFFFKAGDQRHGFRREVEILTKLKRISEHDLGVQTSQIVGLVN
jgi:hypothetical protein